MFDWKSQFTVQRKEYITRTMQRLSAMQAVVNHLAQYPDDTNQLRELSQHFHQLAGSSALYDFDKLGETASSGEKLCLTILRNNEGLNKSEWKSLKDSLESLQYLVSTHPDMQPSALAEQYATPAGQPSWPSGTATGTGEGTSVNVALWNAALDGEFSQGYEKPKDIVIVDGDQASLMTLTRELEDAGMQVRGYRTAQAVRQALRERLPDGLLINLPLPDSPGYEVAQDLRSLPDGAVPPIIIMSRTNGLLDKVTAIRCGADAFFEKTVEPALVVQKLKSLLERDKPSSYRILSVEDDPDQAMAIKQILSTVGYQVDQVSDPRVFEEALAAANPDLLLLDVMLGPVSGFELARVVRSDDRYAATPIIFLTTQNQLNAHVESARVGGDEHLIKPVAPPLLLATVAGRLERARVLKRLIGRDGLTQFLTLSSFMEAAEKMLSRRYHGSGSIVMLMLDIDHMEAINEQHGYTTGDRVIAALAKLLKQGLRNAEVFGRIGGDDFAVIMNDVDDRELAEVATQVLKDFESLQHNSPKGSFNATVSAGAAALDPETDIKGWLTSARLALKSAKASGRNRVMKAKSQAGRFR